MVQMRMEGFKKIGDDLERVIEKDDSNSSVTTESEEGKNTPRTWREKLCHRLHSNKFQIGIVCLVIVDVLLVLSELLIDLKVLELGEETSKVAQVLHYMSIGILSLFMIEILVKLFAFRLEFFRHYLEVFDGLIVIVSFALDVAFMEEHGEGAESAIGLLIILRLWRVTRILNGIILSVKHQADRKLAREKALKQAVEQELNKYRDYCSAQEKEIEMLQGLLRKHGIEYNQVERPVTGRQIDVVVEVNELSDKLRLQEIDLNNTTPA